MNIGAPKRKKFVIRLALVLVYIGLLALMLLTGKQHSILIDNKDAEDGSYQGIAGMAVQIDNLKSAEYYPGDRDMAIVKGQKHKIKVELFTEGKTVEKNFTVPYGQGMILLSVPKMLAGIEPWMEPFVVEQEKPAEGETNLSGSMSFGADSPITPDTPDVPVVPLVQ
jgi:hypothetical protein